jgi:hypothetical protein
MPKTHRIQLALATGLAAVLLAACASAPSPSSEAGSSEGPVGLRAYFPAEAGYTWAYETMTADHDEPGLAILRVTATDERSITFDNGNGPFTWQFDEAGIFRQESRSYILREPIETGHTWRVGRNGRAEIVGIDSTIATPAGTFKHCVVVREVEDEVGLEWWLAPGVGPVAVESWSSEDREHNLVARAVLRSFVKEPIRVARKDSGTRIEKP